MPTYNIRGIKVDFPYEAYECQKIYMEKVLDALNQVCVEFDFDDLQKNTKDHFPCIEKFRERMVFLRARQVLERHFLFYVPLLRGGTTI